jgi:uncharacterized membrane protein
MNLSLANSTQFPTATAQPKPTGGANRQARILWLDLARALAIIFMIQGHTLDVLLAPQYRQGLVFNAWFFLRGLTAPTFLLLCGLSFSVSTVRRWESYQCFSKPLFRRWSRFLFLILLGYAMHLPARSLAGFRSLDRSAWQSWFQVDVLQCVGITLALLQWLVFVTGKPRRFAVAAISLGACIVLLTPIAWANDWSKHIPLGVGAYFTSTTGSLFPLLPWSGYIFIGAAIGALFSLRPRSSRSLGFAAAGLGPVLVTAGMTLESMPIRLYANLDFWKTSPNLFFIRLGCVCIFLTTIAYISQRIPLPWRVVRSLSRWSLAIYLVHICILYGSNWNPGLRQWIGPTLGLLPTLGWIAVLLFSMVLFGLASQWCKEAALGLVRSARVSARAFVHLPSPRSQTDTA